MNVLLAFVHNSDPAFPVSWVCVCERRVLWVTAPVAALLFTRESK